MIPPVLAAVDRLGASGADLEISTGYDNEHVDALRNGSVDLAVGWSDLTSAENPTIVSARLQEVAVRAVVKADDPLTTAAAVRPEDLADRSVVLFDRALAPDPYDIITGWLERVPRTSTVYSHATYASQTGMASTMSTRHDAVTFATNLPLSPSSGSFINLDVEPTITASIWATATVENSDLLAEFARFVADF